jgi:hypothetical protein
VLLAPEAPDRLSNLVLMACTRPHEGIISVPIPADDADEIALLVHDAARIDQSNQDLAAILAEQRTIGT